MRMVLLGCGRLGSQLANLWSKRGDKVAVIDKNPKAFVHLDPDFKGQTIEGIGFDKDVLMKAGIEKADIFVAVTSGDNTNIVATRLAKDYFRVPTVVTRIYDPRRAEIYRHLGVPTVSTTIWAMNQINGIIRHRELHGEFSFGNGEVQVIEYPLPPTVAGHSVNEITVPGEITVASITRDGRAFIPSLGTALMEGDTLGMVVLSSALSKLEKLLSIT